MWFVAAPRVDATFSLDPAEAPVSHKNVNRVSAARKKRVAIVIANPAVSTTTGWPVGFWWAELSHPYFKFCEVGYDVRIFSPSGGACHRRRHERP